MTMRSSFSIALVLLILKLLLVPPVDAAPQPLAENGWILKQKTNTSGDYTVYLTANGVKAMTPSGVAMMCHAPDWVVSISNKHDKCFFERPLKAWQGPPSERLFNSHAQDLKIAPWKAKPDENVLGVKASKYEMYICPPRTQPPTAEHMRFEVEHMNGISSAQAWLLADLKLPPPICMFLARIYSTPEFTKYPLRLTYIDLAGAPNTQIDTLSLKADKIPQSVFAKPAGYKKATSEEQVYSDKRTSQVLENCVEFLGGVDKNKKPENQKK